jgi:hypothetical protein
MRSPFGEVQLIARAPYSGGQALDAVEVGHIVAVGFG